MPRGKTLTEAEKAQIQILHKKGEPKREIAEIIGRSDRVVRNVCSKLDQCDRCSSKWNVQQVPPECL